MYKKLKMWLCHYEIKELRKLEKKYPIALNKILEQHEEIQNLKLRLLQLTNQGEIKWK